MKEISKLTRKLCGMDGFRRAGCKLARALKESRSDVNQGSLSTLTTLRMKRNARDGSASCSSSRYGSTDRSYNPGL